MYIQPQYDTIVPVGSLNLDTTENRLFPGKSHHFLLMFSMKMGLKVSMKYDLMLLVNQTVTLVN